MAKKTAYYGIFAALAILMGYVEAVIPMPVPIPGIKIGLSNIVVVLCMYNGYKRSLLYIDSQGNNIGIAFPWFCWAVV